MSVSTIIGAVIAIAKAVPYIYQLLERLNNAWIDHKVSQARENLNYQQKKERALYEAIKNAKNDDDLVALSILLHELQTSAK